MATKKKTVKKTTTKTTSTSGTPSYATTAQVRSVEHTTLRSFSAVKNDVTKVNKKLEKTQEALKTGFLVLGVAVVLLAIAVVL